MDLTLVLAGVIVFGVGAHSLTLDGFDRVTGGGDNFSGYSAWT